MSDELEQATEQEELHAATIEDFDAVAAAIAPEQTTRALSAVSQFRARDDEERGYWRDYPDSKVGDPVPPYIPRAIAGHDIDSWWLQLQRRVSQAHPFGSNPKAQRDALVAVCGISVAWLEALERREHLRNKMAPAPLRWFRRFRRWLSGVIAP